MQDHSKNNKTHKKISKNRVDHLNHLILQGYMALNDSFV